MAIETTTFEHLLIVFLEKMTAKQLLTALGERY